jgi:transcriptional regulator with XRE-family HTH domain
MQKSIYSTEYKAFLHHLRQARHEKGLTQMDVAQLLGKHQSYITKCENGERRVDIVELAEFARIYDKPIEYFLKKHEY